MKSIFKNRQRTNFKKNSKYLPYVFNDHFILIVIILIGYLAYLYANNLKIILQIKPFILQVLIIFLLFFELHSFKFVTYLEKPDQNFLLPIINHINDSFVFATVYSLILPVFTFTFTAIILTPILHGIKSSFNFLSILILIFGLTILQWAIFICFQQKIYGKIKDKGFLICKEIILVCTLALIFLPCDWLFLLITLTEVILLKCYDHLKPNSILQINIAISEEEKRQSRILRLFSLFIDLPNKQIPVKRRKYLDFFKKFNSNLQNLFLLTFLRSGNYLGLFLRILIINYIVNFFVKDFIVAIVINFTLLYLLLFQLIPIYQQTIDNIYINIFPIAKLKWQRFFRNWLNKVGYIYILLNVIIMILVSPEHYLIYLTYLIGGLILINLMTKIYFPLREKKVRSNAN
ncbi:MAG: ABC transporter permease [Bombilactobacillus mellifer]|nr:ABC transporter permease [Bombilactobacillus mellifer]